METERADEQLQAKVQAELRREASLDPADIGVTVEQGIVALDGHVPSASCREMAREVVRRVTGVRAIVDDLDVRPPGIVPDELHIALEVVDALQREGYSPGGRLKVLVHDGRVRLVGTVDSPELREAAEVAVGNVVVGWGAVENEILVKPVADPRAAAGKTGAGPLDVGL